MDTNMVLLWKELAEIRKEAVSAYISGDRSKADCLTGKAVGMKSTLDIAERMKRKDSEALGELAGMQRVINTLGPLPGC